MNILMMFWMDFVSRLADNFGPIECEYKQSSALQPELKNMWCTQVKNLSSKNMYCQWISIVEKGPAETLKASNYNTQDK